MRRPVIPNPLIKVNSSWSVLSCRLVTPKALRRVKHTYEYEIDFINFINFKTELW